MSIVYLARNIRLGKKVAFKILSPEHAEDDSFRARFVQEAQKAAAIDHPNIIPVFDAGDADGLLFIAMQYVKGPDLKTVLEMEGRLAPDRAVSILLQTASALDAAHAEGLIHRDVKPGNILLVPPSTPDGADHVYLTDFGLTKLSGSDTNVTQAGQVVGTPDYMAPEQIQGRAIDYRVDTYSLGCVAYQCFTGFVPFPRDVELAVLWAQVNEPPPHVTDAVDTLPAALDVPVARAMAKDPDQRYETCHEFASDVRRSLGMGSGERPLGTGTGTGTAAGTVSAPAAPAAPAPGQRTVAEGGTPRVPSQPTMAEAGHTPAPFARADSPTTVAPAAPQAVSGPAPAPVGAAEKPGTMRSLGLPAIIGAGVAAAIVVVLIVMMRGGPASPPGMPEVQAVADGTTAVTLTWAAPDSDASLSGYTIFRDGQKVGTVPAGARSYRDAGLEASTRYTYSIDAFDVDGRHSSRSPAATVQTRAEPFPTDAETSLLARVPQDFRDSCVRAPAPPAPAAASVACTKGDIHVTYTQFLSNPDMYSYYTAQLVHHGVTKEQGHCPDTLPSEEYWYYGTNSSEHIGRLACYVEDGNAWLTWTNNQHSLYQLATTSGTDVKPVYNFWKDAA